MKIQTEVDELGFFGNMVANMYLKTLMPAIIELKKHMRTRNQILTSRKNLIII